MSKSEDYPDYPDMDKDLEGVLESYYAEDPKLGDMVFLKGRFEDTTIRGEVIGMRRSQPQRALNPNGTFEIVLYPALEIMIGAIEVWLDLEDWEITDTLSGIQYKKLPPDVVAKKMQENDDEQKRTNNE